jgi:hypothetical protein
LRAHAGNCLDRIANELENKLLQDVSEWDEDGELIFKTSGELTAEQKVAVSEIAQERGRDGARTLKIRLYGKLAAMGHLAKLLNLLVDRQEISGPNGGPVEVTDHRTRIMDRLNAIAKRQAPDNDGDREALKSGSTMAALRGFTGLSQASPAVGTRASPCSAWNARPLTAAGAGDKPTTGLRPTIAQQPNCRTQKSQDHCQFVLFA